MRAKEKFVIGVLGVSSLLLGGVSIWQQETILAMDTEIVSLEGDVKLNQQKIQALAAENSNLHTTIESLTISHNEEIDRLRGQMNDLDADLKMMQDFYNYDSAKVSFDSSNLRSKSGATVHHMRKALYGTDLFEHAEAYVVAEKAYGVNALGLAALTAHEAKWGTSNRAVNDNNLTGYAVYSNESVGGVFSSAAMNIIKTAELLDRDYLSENGKWYNGKSLKDINKKYCFGKDGKPDFEWSKSIESIAYDLMGYANK